MIQKNDFHGEKARRMQRAEALILAVVLMVPCGAWARDEACDVDDDPTCVTPLARSLDTLKSYMTSPLHWSGRDWWYAGGVLAAVGVAHQFDGSVRKHFTGDSAASLNHPNTHDLQDALPMAALFLGTWGYAKVIDDAAGRREAHTMFESAVLSVGAAYLFQFAAGRERPYQTTDPNRWRAGGSSFPSVHATAAFAIGTVLAESGGYPWIRRVLGYGAAGFTVYERLDHNAHWLSDTVAGAALGSATARFAMTRNRDSEHDATIGIAPIYQGVMLTYRVPLH
jgi:membrane-associated phospholipid phosphatase